ncbi:MAG: hypothetical protein HKN42_07290 [Granulosicoccus sp.]|nr:hypothetical protein [Granulosicoccus sp.]
MALVLLLLGVLTRAALKPYAAAQKNRHHAEVVAQLNSIKRGLWSHVIATGALPCPLAVSSGQAPRATRPGRDPVQPCRVAQGGVPARRLGLPGAIDDGGALLDPWNRPYLYVVSLASHAERGNARQPDWIAPGEASLVGIRELSADIVLCAGSSPLSCPTRDVTANQLAFVVFSTGLDDSATGVQSENLDADRDFVLQEHSVHPEHPYDDQLIWGSAAETMYWMLRAGWLP